jgi:hypothetical protein
LKRKEEGKTIRKDIKSGRRRLCVRWIFFPGKKAKKEHKA